MQPSATVHPMRTVKDTVFLQLEGELDHAGAARVRAQLDQLIADPQVRRLVLDFQSLSFMDSSGIGVLIGRYRTLVRRGGSLAVRNVPKQVDRVFQMSGLYQIIEKCR